MDRVLVAVFFSCPRSVRELHCHLNDCVRPPHQAGSGVISSPADTSDVTLMRQHAPLDNLTELSIGGDFHPRIEDLFAMLMNCPKIVTLEIPRIRLPFQTSLVTPSFAKHCPNLQNLAQRVAGKNYSQCIIMSIVLAMAEGLFKSLKIRGFNDTNDRLCSTLQPHFESLVCIYFDGCKSVSGRAILTVLCSCPVLEEFVVGSSSSFPECFIALEDATTHNWVATRLKTLCMIVYIKDIDYLDLCLNWDEYTSQEQLTLLQLDSFYKQIGALVDLKDLDLRLCPCLKEGESSGAGDGEDHSDGNIPEYFHRSLPGLMTLGSNVRSNDRGWLQCLSGLSKLEFLSGSINVIVGTDECVLNQDDVRWIATHWPKLKEAHFVCQDQKGIPECLVWLRKELPGLCLFP
ncbi:MAG: hypothetical protein JOS17DRAFT_766711 [Linnemannia elongata]|nr:MAG: hypothetical protein JOS17DRAFT_766711 [Linnemannia elongata]